MQPFFRTRAGVLAGALVMLMTSAATSAFAQTVCGIPDAVPVYALTTDNTIFRYNPATGRYTRTARVSGIDGNLIGIDFRPADASATSVYGTTDTGKIYLIDLSSAQPAVRLISTLAPRLAGGFQSLMDFNPTNNALRLIGSNDQNIAVINANDGNLNQTVQQTALRYPAGDAFAGVDPNITAGAYTNNVANARSTTFYMIDYDLDTFVTIKDNNTGNGMLKTIGPFVDQGGNPINFAANAGLDVYTGPDGRDVALAVSGQTLYCVDLTSFDPLLPPGTLQKVVASPVQRFLQPMPQDPSIVTGGFIDVAVSSTPQVMLLTFPSLHKVLSR
jgi:hypothetical protein